MLFNTEIVIASFALAGVLVIMNTLGLFRKSFSVALNDHLNANYTRSGILLWDLTISAKDASAGIKQGRFLLPFAIAHASLVAQGKATII